jgi:hypothetical protein
LSAGHFCLQRWGHSGATLCPISVNPGCDRAKGRALWPDPLFGSICSRLSAVWRLRARPWSTSRLGWSNDGDAHAAAFDVEHSAVHKCRLVAGQVDGGVCDVVGDGGFAPALVCGCGRGRTLGRRARRSSIRSSDGRLARRPQPGESSSAAIARATSFSPLPFSCTVGGKPSLGLAVRLVG